MSGEGLLPDLVRRDAARAQVGAMRGRVGATRAGVIGTLVVLIVATTCIRLGIWQLDRLEQRRGSNALVEERLAQPAIAPGDVPADSAAALYLRVRLVGGCEGEQIVLAGRSRHGAPGVHLLCRFRARDGRTVLLDRGWLPSADARTVPPEIYRRAPRDTVLEAILLPFPPGEADTRTRSARITADTGAAGDAPRVMYRLNRAQAEAATGLDLPAWYAQATGPAGGLPVPADPPALGDGPHLGYAVQWFSFALIALVGWAVLARQERRPRRPKPEG